MKGREYIEEICRKSKKASYTAAGLSTVEKNSLLNAIAKKMRERTDYIISENKKDLEEAQRMKLSTAMYDRLLLTPERIEGMAVSVEEIAAQEEPVGRIENMKKRPSGITVGQMRVPVGVVAVIFESRPNVTTDIAALCIKSGNSSILRGGEEAIYSNTALYSIVKETIAEFNLPVEMVTLITELDRDLVPVLLKMNEYIDIVIPRGGHGLISLVTKESLIPVIKHDRGLCHLYIDDSAEEDMANSIAVNAKVQRPGVCNAVETILIHSGYKHTDTLIDSLIAEGVEVRGCERTSAFTGKVIAATPLDWDTEYLDLIVSVKIVDSMDEAIDHITTFSSGHSEAIVTSNYSCAQKFLSVVDSAAVFVNASTRFHDGGEFGLGAEVGISTQKLHSRGAMGVEGLTTLKYIVYGNGEVR